MSVSSGSPRLLKGGLVLIDPSSGAVQRVIALQYNPETLTRTLAPQSAGGSAATSEPLRLKGPPVETIRLDAELDATDQLEKPEQHPTTVKLGLHPQLALLETLVYPSSARLVGNNELAKAGTLEIVPAVSALTLFVWSAERVVPVRLTDLSIVEDGFDASLNPIRAKVTLSMRVLSVNDLGFDNKGGHIYLAHHQRKEALAARAAGSSLTGIGLQANP